MKPFVVMALPRSRTAWLSVFLTSCGVATVHEGLAGYPTVEYALDDLAGCGYFGTCDTLSPGLAPDLKELGCTLVWLGPRNLTRTLNFCRSHGTPDEFIELLVERFEYSKQFADLALNNEELDDWDSVEKLLKLVHPYGPDFGQYYERFFTMWQDYRHLNITHAMEHMKQLARQPGTQKLFARMAELDEVRRSLL